jgi:hypothetical protein
VLVRLAVDATGFSDLASSNSVATRASQRLLIQQLMQSAILVLADPATFDDLPQAVRPLPQELRKLWTAFLGEVVAIPPSVPIKRTRAEISELDDLREWAGQISVALASHSTATRLGLEGEQSNLVDNVSSIEITRLQATDSKRLRAAIDVQQRDIQQLEAREDAWNERFKIAASTGARITILDRYAVTNLAKNLNQGAPCGFAWFLDKVATETAVPVHLITRANTASDAGRLAADLRRLGKRLSGDGVATLSVTFASNHAFGQRSHPRHVRFGKVAIGLDKGLSTFDEPLCPHSMPCAPVSRDTARAREEQIEHLALEGYRRRVIW